MISQEIRRNFLNYFKSKGHAIVPSSPVVPHEDPTLLFTNAGMNQFKDVFLGSSKRDYNRATTSQKCIRVGGKHNDLDNVGHTSRHLTFFEMLGNFSFGDYFKKDAIDFAWEVTAQVFEFDLSRVWISVFEKDDETFELWKKHVPEKRIVRMGEKDNFWAMGDTGPCGPCSELYYDKGEKYGSAASPVVDATGERYLEFWNLVFMQFNRDTHGKMAPLPNQSIDTGSGLERVISLKLGVDNVFHTDILRHLIGQIEAVSGKKYVASDAQLAPAFHVIADHIRSLTFAIADGAQPSNIERGYVLRKLIRRAVRYGRTLLGVEGPFLAQVLPALVETMGSDYREIVTAKDRIAEILTLEEENFLRTLKRGGNILSSIVEQALKSPQKQISGADAFKLKDTYGFPLEEILLIAKDSNLQVNIDAYQLLEEKAKEISRSSRTVQGQEAEESFYVEFVKKHPPAEFVGYTEMSCETEIAGIVKDGQFADRLELGEVGLVILKKTPFYAEQGGQVGDTGEIFNQTARMRVTDCKKPYPGVVAHGVKVENGSFKIGDRVTAAIDQARRSQIAAHHTATHLLHYALQKILGSHIRQAGSLVDSERLRFDFNHHKAVSAEEVQKIEDMVNELIRQNQGVSTYELPFQEVQRHPEIKQFFGEKYGAQVRVVDINYSKELCGGTHALHVGMLGYFRITKESSIAAGVRRIEACCGKAAEEFVRKEELKFHEAAALAKTTPGKLGERIGQLVEEVALLKEQMKGLKMAQLKQLSEALAKKAEHGLLTAVVDIDPADLGELMDEVLRKMGSGVVALSVKMEDRVQLAIKISADRIQKGANAGALIKQVSPLIGGSGGGRPEMAQAGGKNPEGIPEAFKLIKQLVSL
ncbi:MAG: alanine--tRNA ligase [Verrucomicrobia bacterium]|nr:alanine--tRNA ligase [Verrucomicrobiota bacterium]